jgi:hypothetical protein
MNGPQSITQGYEPYPGCGAQDFTKEFLVGKRITLEAFCKNEHIDPRDLPRLVSEVLTEWELTEAEHATRKNAVSHMINHLRIKARKENYSTGKDMPSPRIRSNSREIDIQTERRAKEAETRRKNSMSPRDYIRSLGFDPDKVTSVAAAMRLSREGANPNKTI